MASADYLKKYYSSSSADKKKKKKSSSTSKGIKIIEEDAFIAVKPQEINLPSDDDDDVREKMQQAERLQFKTDGFEEIELEPREESIGRDDGKGQKDTSRKRKRKDSDSSPVRKRHSSDDNSPPRRGNHSPDNSPPRRSNRDRDSAKRRSPTRRMKREPDSDPSSPRRNDNRRRRGDDDASPPRRRTRNESPVRRVKREPDSDASPPRRGGRNSEDDLSPPRARRRHDSDNDMSPPRRGRSPKQQKTLDGKKAGLVTAAEMREEAKLLKDKDKKAMEKMDELLSGRFAETKVRESQIRRGRKKDKEEEEKKARELKKTEEMNSQYEKWNRGVVQLRQREEQLKEEMQVMKEGFARHADDARMNENLKDAIYEEDPMASMMTKKRTKIKIRKGLEYPSFKGQYPPNRYNIPPGYRWDGVDRSGGFEAKLYLAANRREAEESSTYRAITELQE